MTQRASVSKTKKGLRAKKSQVFRAIQAFSKKVFVIFRELSGVLRDKKENGHDLIPFSKHQKLVLSSAEDFEG